MLTVAEASRAIADAMPAFDKQTVPLDRACGRLLRQSVNAERDQPPFDSVTMDGIAISFDGWESGIRSYRIQGTQHAGDTVQMLEDPGNCIEIMTGGVLPRGADCVIAVERIDVADGTATIESGYEPQRRQFIHPQGSDYRQDTEVLAEHTVITPMEIAIIASCGLGEVDVSEQPVIRVISTGNELVAPGEPIELHQVRLSNGPALVAMLGEQGFDDSAHEHIVDDPDILASRLSALLAESNVLVLSGGVSMGKADFVPGVLADLGVEVVFHKISQRPGKPMWFGIGPDGQAVFALPGNPVSSLVCCRQYVLPALLHASGRPDRNPEYAVLGEDVQFQPDLTCFLPVRLSHSDDGMIGATPVPTNTSGDFAALSGTDGYIELPKEEHRFPKGTAVRLHRWVAP
jgi:molybdopterin molybdotransferase